MKAKKQKLRVVSSISINKHLTPILRDAFHVKESRIFPYFASYADELIKGVEPHKVEDALNKSHFDYYNTSYSVANLPNSGVESFPNTKFLFSWSRIVNVSNEYINGDTIPTLKINIVIDFHREYLSFSGQEVRDLMAEAVILDV